MPKFTDFTVHFWDDALNSLGSTTDVLYMRYRCSVDVVGDGEFWIPLVDTPARQYIAKYNIATFGVLIDSTQVCFGEIVIDRWDEVISPNGLDVLKVSGLGRMSKLQLERMNWQVISDGANGPASDAVGDILALSQYATWAGVGTTFGSPYSNASAYLVTANETLFDAVVQALHQNNHHVIDIPGRYGTASANEVAPTNEIHTYFEMDQLSNSTAGFTGPRLMLNPADDEPLEMPILSITPILEEKELVTRAIIHGGGLGSGQFTISAASATKSAPTGFSYDFTNSVITNTALEAESNQPIKSGLAHLSNIKPQDPSNSTSVLTAAEQLVDAGQLWIQERDGGFDEYYRVKTVADFTNSVTHQVPVPGLSGGIRLSYSNVSPYDTTGNLSDTTIIDVDIVTHILDATFTVTAGNGPFDNKLLAEYLLGPAPRQERAYGEQIANRLKEMNRRLDHADSGAATSAPAGTNYVTTDAHLLTAVNQANLNNERAGTDGLGTVFTDNGAGTTFQFDIRTPQSITSSSTNDPGTTSTGHTHAADGTLATAAEAFVTIGNTANLSAERALTAGDGLDLTDGGANSTVTLAVDVTDIIDTSAGLTETSNNIQIDLATNSGLTFSTGDLTLGTPGTITTSSTNAVTTTTHTHAIDGTIAASNLAYVTIGNTASLTAERALTAGDGLDLTDGGANSTVTLSVDVTDLIGSGIVEEATNNIALGTPGTLTGATTNNVTASSHTHAVSLNHSDIGGQTDSDHHPPVTLGGDISPLMSIGAGQILTFDTQTANTFLAGPTSGSAADPSMRALVIDDMPATVAASMLFSAIKRLPGLVAFYPLSHIPSNQLTDVVGGFHMTNNNTGVFNADTSYRNYVTLNGTNQYFSIADGSFTEISGTESYIHAGRRGLTIMAAVQFDSAASPGTPEFIVAKRASTTGTRGYGLLRNGTGTIGFTVHNGTTENAVNTSQTLGGSTWGFVCARYDPSTSVEVRLDDNADATNTTSIISSIQNNSEAFTIGARSDGSGGGTAFAGADIGWVAVSRMVVQDEWVDLIQALSDKVY